jgi:hypothetical protein
LSRTYPKLILELLYGMELTGDEVDADQVLHWMASIAAAFGDLDPGERADLVSTARELADEAESNGDPDRADAFRRVADAEDAA